MNQNIIAAVESLLNSDAEVTPEQRKDILAACKGSRKRRLIKRKEALKLLGVSAPTLLTFIRSGKVDLYRLSLRKCRFDLDQIEFIANGGDVNDSPEKPV